MGILSGIAGGLAGAATGAAQGLSSATDQIATSAIDQQHKLDYASALNDMDVQKQQRISENQAALEQQTAANNRARIGSTIQSAKDAMPSGLDPNSQEYDDQLRENTKAALLNSGDLDAASKYGAAQGEKYKTTAGYFGVATTNQQTGETKIVVDNTDQRLAAAAAKSGNKGVLDQKAQDKIDADVGTEWDTKSGLAQTHPHPIQSSLAGATGKSEPDTDAAQIIKNTTSATIAQLTAAGKTASIPVVMGRVASKVDNDVIPAATATTQAVIGAAFKDGQPNGDAFKAAQEVYGKSLPSDPDRAAKIIYRQEMAKNANKMLSGQTPAPAAAAPAPSQAPAPAPAPQQNPAPRPSADAMAGTASYNPAADGASSGLLSAASELKAPPKTIIGQGAYGAPAENPDYAPWMAKYGKAYQAQEEAKAAALLAKQKAAFANGRQV